MRQKRQSRRSGITDDSGEGLGASSKTPARIVTHFHTLRATICRLLCRKELFNRDMSLEIDALHIELERLREVRDDR